MTLHYPDFKGPAKKIEDHDISRIAHGIGVGEDEVHMLMDVEAAGSGFDSQGRPKMLFEPHVFYKQIAPARRAAAVDQGLAYEDWGAKPYPKESYTRLAAAMKLDEEAALKSASWGAEQLMGFNYKLGGFKSIYDMVNAHCEDEENHIQAMIDFVKASGIDDELRDLAALNRPTTAADTAPIALRYNGKGYKKNNYHVKLAAAHNKWRKIPDTPWSPEKSGTAPIIVPEKTPLGMVKDDIREIQMLLKDKGYIEVGKIDGVAGKDTISAVTSFQVVEGLPVDGKVTRELLEKLRAAKMRPVSEDRANATKADVINEAAPAVVKTVKNADFMNKIATGVTAISGVGLILDGDLGGLDKALAAVNKVQAISAALGDMLPWIVGLGGGGAALYVGSKIVSGQIEGFRKGTIR